MEPRERTSDVYEQLPGYPPPPLVAVPDLADPAMLARLGLRPDALTRRIVAAATRVTGLGRFQQRLPGELEGLLRRTDLRGGFLCAPIVSATVALADDPRHPDALTRAATLLHAARTVYDDVVHGRLPADETHGQAEEMGQYRNLFATCLVVERRRSWIFKSDCASRIAVALDRRLYTLEIGEAGAPVTVGQLRAALAALVSSPRPRLAETEAAAGLLTAASHGTQLRAFTRLARVPENAAALAALRHCLLVLCLDLDAAPATAGDAAALAHAGNCGNRWYHAGLQLVVFGNGSAGAICNFGTYVDGNTMTRAGAELQRRAAACALDAEAREARTSLPPATALRWRIDRTLAQRARREVRALLDAQPATFALPIGRRALAEAGLSPVGAFVVALQLAAGRLTGRRPRITQFLTLSRYRCMDLAAAEVTTPEILRCVARLERGDAPDAEAATLLAEAVRSHDTVCRETRRWLPPEDLLALFFASRRGWRRVGTRTVAGAAAWLLRRLGRYPAAPREILISHPTIHPEVPVIGRPGVRLPYLRCFGLHYQLFDDRTVVTVMPAIGWTVPNTELAAELCSALERVHETARAGAAADRVAAPLLQPEPAPLATPPAPV